MSGPWWRPTTRTAGIRISMGAACSVRIHCSRRRSTIKCTSSSRCLAHSVWRVLSSLWYVIVRSWVWLTLYGVYALHCGMLLLLCMACTLFTVVCYCYSVWRVHSSLWYVIVIAVFGSLCMACTLFTVVCYCYSGVWLTLYGVYTLHCGMLL